MSLIEPSSGDDESAVAVRGNGPLRSRDKAGSPVIFDVSGNPVTPERVRKVHRWMLLLLLTPICLAGISLLVIETNGPPEPVIHPRSTPAGYQAVTDAYFGYAVPAGYKQNSTWTDANADTFYGEPKAFVAETDVVTKHAPDEASVPPASFESFGESKIIAYRRGPAQQVAVPGTIVAYEEQITRPGGYRATAVDAWEKDTSTQIWLLVHAPPAVTRTVIGSLQG